MLRFFIILILSISNYVSAKENKFEKRLQKDIKKLSRISGFVDHDLTLYNEDEITDKKNTIVIIFNHGQQVGQKKVERCNKGAADVPEFVRNLHNKKINGLTIKIYRMCSGVRGLNDPQMDRAHNMIEQDGNTTGLLEIVDYDGIRLFDKVKQHLRRKILLDKIDELNEKNFPNIVLMGHSCGAFLSIYLTAHFPEKIKASIVTNPACYGENIEPRNIIGDKNTYSIWKALRDNWEQTISKFSEINSLAFMHDEDPFENIKTLSFLGKINKFEMINYTDFGCEKMFGTNFHTAPVYPAKDNCFTKWEAKNNYIINYLEEVFEN
jgi:hypothetical protein